MLCALRSVIPTVAAMSRKRTPGSWAMQTRTRAWLVRKLQSVIPAAQYSFTFPEIHCQFCPNGRTMGRASPPVRRIRRLPAGVRKDSTCRRKRSRSRRSTRNPTKEAPCRTRYHRTHIETLRPECPSGGAGAVSRCSRVIRLENRPRHRNGGSATRATTSCSAPSFGRRDAEVPMERAATRRPRARPRRRRPQIRPSRRSRCSDRHSAIRSRRGHPVHDRDASGPPRSPRQVRRPSRSHR
jgi:hypothetical protein